MKRLALVTAIALAMSASFTPARADTQYTLLSARDTVCVERLALTTDRAQARMWFRMAGMRMVWSLATSRGDDGQSRPASLALAIYPIAAADTAQPQARAAVQFGADSVRVTNQFGLTQSFGGTRGAWPYINPSMAMLACALRDLRPASRDTLAVPLFMLQGGGVLSATVTALPDDSVLVNFAGIEMRFARDASGLVTGGVIPAQGLRLESNVVMSGDAYRGPAPATYEAPANANYTAEPVRVPCAGGFQLAGTLTKPLHASGALPCVLTLSGSGLQDRDEALPIVSGYRPFRQVAEALAARGIATLRLDDRGFGQSGGDPTHATTADFADDARAALAWLRARTDIDGARLALVGHSEGAMIAPMVAAANEKGLAAIVLMAGPSRTGRRVIEYQTRQALMEGGALKGDSLDARVRESMARTDSSALGTPWLRYFLDYDPLVAARKVRVPALVLQGATDRQVEAAQAAELGAALRAAGNRDVTVRVLPGVNHLFLEDPIGDPAGYARLPERQIRREILDLVSDWLAKRLRAK